MKKVPKKILQKTTNPSRMDDSIVQHTAGGSLSMLNNIRTQDAPLNEIVTLTERLISVPSITGDINKAVEIMQIVKHQLADHTFTPYVSNGFPSLLYSNQNTNNFKIILNAHLDVVPGESEQYNPQIIDGKLYGRGAYDMKGAAAIMILLFDELADQVDYPLGLQLVADEELAEGHSTNNQIEHGVRAELAIIGECGSNFDIVHETKGLVHAKLKTTGATAHGAYLWNGRNAILKMYEAIHAIQQHFPVPNGATNKTTINISMIETGNQTWNKVPENCTATLDIRFNKDDGESIVAQLQSILPEGAELHIEKIRKAHYSDPSHPFITQLTQIGKETFGKELAVRNTFGGSDTVFFSNVGCDAIEFGPKGSGQHNGEEWVDIKSLAQYYQILKKFLLSVK